MSDCPCGMASETCEYHRETKPDAADGAHACQVGGGLVIRSESRARIKNALKSAIANMSSEAIASDVSEPRSDLATAVEAFRVAKAGYESIRESTEQAANELRRLDQMQADAFRVADVARGKVLLLPRAHYDLDYSMPAETNL